MSPEYIRADMIFKGDKFKTPDYPRLLVATEEPVIHGPDGKRSVTIQAEEITSRRNRRITVPYGATLKTWTELR